MKYTTSQKIFWSTLTVLLLFFSWFWFSLFKNQAIESVRLIVLVISQTIILALLHRWGVDITRRGDFKSGRMLREYPTEVDKWNTVQVGVLGVTVLFGALPPALAFMVSVL